MPKNSANAAGYPSPCLKAGAFRPFSVMTEQQIARFMGDTGALIKRETLIEIIAAAAQRLAKTQTP